MEKLKPFIDSELEHYKKLPQRVREEVDLYSEYIKADLVSSLRVCESPIEQLFHIYFRTVMEDLRNELYSMDTKSTLVYSPQSEVYVNGKNYRLDFHVSCSVNERHYKFAIECDGHDFHEKTKEQVAKDKARERDLISEGYVVIRFAGSEIWKNPFKCVKEADGIIDNHVGVSKYWKEYIDSLTGGDQNGETN